MHQNDVRARLVQVIEVEHYRGEDVTSGLPPRWVKTYWDMKGNLLAESDPQLAETQGKHGGKSSTTTETFRR